MWYLKYHTYGLSNCSQPRNQLDIGSPTRRLSRRLRACSHHTRTPTSPLLTPHPSLFLSPPSAMQVRYVIYEDGDVLEHPNIFSVAPAGTALTLRDVRAAFPVPGRYHFRAMKSWKNTYGASSPPLVLVSLRLYTVAIAALSPPRGVAFSTLPPMTTNRARLPSLVRSRSPFPSVRPHTPRSPFNSNSMARPAQRR